MITKRNKKGQIVKIERDAYWLFNKITPVTETGCWLWNGHVGKHGYGTYTIGSHPNSRGVTTHRLSWEIHNGVIPDGMFVLHKCDVRSCVNPDHLFLGTHRDNMDDAKRKGRMSGRPNSKGVKVVRKLTHKDKDEVISLLKENKLTNAEIGEIYNVHAASINYYNRYLL